MWPFSKGEKRSTDSYTDLLIDFAVQRATGTTTPAVGAVGALQAAAGLVSRCFAAATVEGPANRIASLTPGTLSRIGRALIRSGEIVMVVDVDPGGAVQLHPASSWDVQGSVDPASWVYRCSLPGTVRDDRTHRRRGGRRAPAIRDDPERAVEGTLPGSVGVARRPIVGRAVVGIGR